MGLLGASWDDLVASWAVLEAFWALLEASWVAAGGHNSARDTDPPSRGARPPPVLWAWESWYFVDIRLFINLNHKGGKRAISIEVVYPYGSWGLFSMLSKI